MASHGRRFLALSMMGKLWNIKINFFCINLQLMVHTVIEVMRMDKKFIAAVAVCFVALVGVARELIFLGKKATKTL